MPDNDNQLDSIALIGGGPAALFMMKQIDAQKLHTGSVHIFERQGRLGAGMPYSNQGAGREHVANVSANELPELAEDFTAYYEKHRDGRFPEFGAGGLNVYEVIPRLLLGDYLEHEFKTYIKKIQSRGTAVHVHLNTAAEDIIPDKDHQGYTVVAQGGHRVHVQNVVLCTGHSWPKKHEDRVPGWYDSPYPPSKFSGVTNFPVAIRGASLTAVDAIKTLARLNGRFTEKQHGLLKYTPDDASPSFRIDLYSLRGFMPALRFHAEGAPFATEWTMKPAEIAEYKEKHGGFVDLDYVFERNFMQPLRQHDPDFYARVKDLSLEEFAEEMLKIRHELDSWLLLKAEYAEAEKSIERHQSVVWKETLSAFSYAVNYPAKHFSAEDLLRLKKKLMPLISIIIASLPQSSYREMMALHNAGLLSSNAVGEESEVLPAEEGAIYKIVDEDGNTTEKKYRMFVDAIGQKPLNFGDIPFEGLKSGELSTGFVNFKYDEQGRALFEKAEKGVRKNPEGGYYLEVPGLEINDYFQAMDSYAAANPRLYIMAVPFIGGLNPDYSGLDFCDTASERIVRQMKTGIIDF